MAVQREWCLHRGVRRFVRRAVALPYLFANHDRSAKSSEYAHIGEQQRGAVAGWPDTALHLPGRYAPVRPDLREIAWKEDEWVNAPFTLFGELKWGANKPSVEQIYVGTKLTHLGYGWCCVYSVQEYAEAALSWGVPLLPNWEYVAKHEDELVAADIRKAEAKAGDAPKPTRRRGKGITTAMLVGR